MSEQNGAEKELQPTPAAEFRAMRERGVTQRLPSGRIMRMRVVTPAQLLRLGKIPDVLTTLALKSLYGQLDNSQLQAFLDPQEGTQDALEMLESLRVVCTAAVVYPRIVEEPQDEDEIHIDDLSPVDQGYIFQLAFWEAEALSRFRYEPQTDVADLSVDAGDEQPAEPASGGTATE